MQFLSIAALGLVAAVSASPVEKSDWKYTVGWDGVTLPAGAIGAAAAANSTELEKRTVGGVYICTDINWGGTCGYAVQPLNECITLGSDWSKQISSFGPDPCTTCTAWETYDCSTYYYPSGQPLPTWTFTNPGDATGGLGTQTPWNDEIQSFECYQSC